MDVSPPNPAPGLTLFSWMGTPENGARHYRFHESTLRSGSGLTVSEIGGIFVLLTADNGALADGPASHSTTWGPVRPAPVFCGGGAMSGPLAKRTPSGTGGGTA